MTRTKPFSGIVKEYTEERFIGYIAGKVTMDYKIVHKYDGSKLTEIHTYSSKNKLTNISYYNYDHLQNITEILIKTAKGTIKQRIIYEYINNRLSHVTNISKIFKIVTKYDESGNPLQNDYDKSKDDLPCSTKFNNKYDVNQRLKEKQIMLPNDELDSIIQYKYNNEGLLLEENITNCKTSFLSGARENKISKNLTSKHSYNDHCDLILSKFFADGQNNETHKKEISYDGTNSICEIKDFRKGRAFLNKDTFALISVTKFSYVR